MKVKRDFIIVFIVFFLILTNHLSAAVDLTGWNHIDLWSAWSYANPTVDSGRLDETVSSPLAGPTWVVSDFILPTNCSFSLTIEVDSSTGDDDFIGFAFCYQDNSNFYLLDWKKQTQTYNFGDPVAINDDIAEQGLKLKKINGSWTRDGLWGGKDGIGVSTLAGETGPGWVLDEQYTFDITLTSGNIDIDIDGGDLFEVSDSTFQGGAIALYGFSQDNLVFSNVTYVPEPCTIALLGLGGLVLVRRKRI